MIKTNLTQNSYEVIKLPFFKKTFLFMPVIFHRSQCRSWVSTLWNNTHKLLFFFFSDISKGLYCYPQTFTCTSMLGRYVLPKRFNHIIDWLILYLVDGQVESAFLQCLHDPHLYTSVMWALISDLYNWWKEMGVSGGLSWLRCLLSGGESCLCRVYLSPLTLRQAEVIKWKVNLIRQAAHPC